MPDDIRIKNSNDLENWLNSLPENIRRQAAIAIASRAALRTIPILEFWLTEETTRAISSILPILRANYTSWILGVVASYSVKLHRIAVSAANYVNKVSDVARIAADTHAAKATRNDINADIAQTAANAAAAFSFAANAAAFASHATVSNAITYAAANACANACAAISFITLTGFYAAWSAVENDVNALFNGGAVQALMRTSLWPTGTPDWAVESWQSMKRRLLAREGEHWEVWTKWYDARLDPSRRIPCYSPPDLKLEEARVLLPDELWEQGPAAVNARIKALLEESGCADKEARDAKLPSVPEQEPATIEVEWEGDRLIMRHRPVKPGDMPDETLLAALQALRQQLRQTVDTLQADQSANAIDPRIIEQLRQVVDLLPGNTPVDQAQLIQLAMQVDELRAYMQGMSNDEALAWPEILRHKVQTQIDVLHAFLDRFRVWQIVPAPEAREMTEEEVQATPSLAEEIEQALEELGKERADLAISHTLHRLRQRLAALLEHAGSAARVARERAADLRRGIANIFKGVAQWVLGRLRVFRREFTPAVDEEVQIFARWLAKWGRRVLQGLPLAAAGWMAKTFGWLPAVLEWLHKILGL